jgi:hypothetical protein
VDVPFESPIAKPICCIALALVFSFALRASLPEPPRQHAPWQPVPVAGVPQYVPELVAMLFDAGLADPRGGEYREIEIKIRYGDSSFITTHGWYFKQGFAVCWDGLAHRVVRAGGKADLDQDVAAGRPTWEATVLLPQIVAPVGVALLLRLGKADLAARLSLKESGVPARLFTALDQDPSQINQRQWFDYAATSWLSAAFHEAVSAHAIGDDRTAADVSEYLMRAGPSSESAGNKLFPYPPNTQASLDFLKPVPALLADSERRLKKPPHAARRLFVAPDGAGNPARWLLSGISSDMLVYSPLLIQPVFRESVLAALGRREAAGTIERTPDDHVIVSIGNSSSVCGPGCPSGANGKLAPGKRDLRICDHVARALSMIQGSPKIDLEASTEAKDQAIAAIGEFLRANAGRLSAEGITMSFYPVYSLSLGPR